MKNKHFLTLPLGLILLAIALILQRFFPENDEFDFIAGFLIGLSIVLNLTYIYKRSKRTLSS